MSGNKTKVLWNIVGIILIVISFYFGIHLKNRQQSETYYQNQYEKRFLAEASTCGDDNFSEVPQSELNECYEKIRNNAWGEMQIEIGKHGVDQNIAESQIAWEAYAVADCELEGSLYGDGSLRPAVKAQCLSVRAYERIDRLKNFPSDDYVE